MIICVSHSTSGRACHMLPRGAHVTCYPGAPITLIIIRNHFCSSHPSTSSTAIRSSLGSLEIKPDSMLLDPGHRSLMRHFKSERNAVRIKGKQGKEGKIVFLLPGQQYNSLAVAQRLCAGPRLANPSPGQLLVVRHWRRFQWIHLVD